MEKFFLTLIFAAVAFAQLDPNARLNAPVSALRRSDGPLLPTGKDATYLDYDYDETIADPLGPPADPYDLPAPQSRPRLRNSKPFRNQNTLGAGDCRSKTRAVAHEKYCDLYYHTTGCDDSQRLLRSCPNGLLFTGNGQHGLVGVCDYPHNVNCQGREKHMGGLGQGQRVIEQEDPCTAKSKVVGDVTYCDRYWECFQGNPELYDCPNGLIWVGKNRGIADGCDYPWRNPNLCQNKDLANPPISTEHCDWLYGIFGHETSCTRYWTCWNGTATEQFCVGGLLYNEDTHACDWPEHVGGCQKHPLCKDDANGNVPLGKSCNRYWACQGGYPRLQRCPAMLVFDKTKKRCVSPPTEDCDVPPTQPPEAEDENQDGNGNGNKGKRPNKDGQRRRLQGQGGGPGGGGGVPFQLPEGATLLQRPNN